MARDADWDIFLSYAAEDLEAARELRSRLVAAGWRVFLAGDDLDLLVGSAQWSERIDQILDSTTALVLLVTHNALHSRWVSYEWRSVHDTILSGRSGMLVPVCWDGIAPENLPRALRRYQCVDARGADQREAKIEAISTLVRGYLDEVRRPGASTVPVSVAAPRPARRSSRGSQAVVALAITAAGMLVWLRLAPPPAPAAATAPRPAAPALRPPTQGLLVISIFETADDASVGQIRSVSAWAEAERDFETANQQAGTPTRWQAAQQLAAGQRAMLEGRSDEAADKLRRAVQIEPAWATAHVALSGVLIGTPAAAIEAAERARALDASSWTAIVALGNAYLYAGDRQRALEEYRRALTLRPQSALLKGQLSIALHSAGGEYDLEAERLAREALGESDQLVAPRLVLAELALERGQGQQALLQAQAAASLAPRDVRAQLAVGDALQLLDDRKNARAAWSTALRLSESSPTVGVASARLEQVATALKTGRMPPARNQRPERASSFRSRPRPDPPSPSPNRSRPNAYHRAGKIDGEF